jgi:hypothetical protein
MNIRHTSNHSALTIKSQLCLKNRSFSIDLSKTNSKRDYSSSLQFYAGNKVALDIKREGIIWKPNAGCIMDIRWHILYGKWSLGLWLGNNTGILIRVSIKKGGLQLLHLSYSLFIWKIIFAKVFTMYSAVNVLVKLNSHVFHHQWRQYHNALHRCK